MSPPLVLGIEGSANKIAVGIVGYDGQIYANIRKTYISDAGKGFIPRETQRHHARHIIDVLDRALLHAYQRIFSDDAQVPPQKQKSRVIDNIACLCYTKGPGMAGCLGVGATVVRVLAQLWRKTTPLISLDDLPKKDCDVSRAFANVFASPRLLHIIGVNHCVAHIEMGRLVCGIQPHSDQKVVVLYVSGGNTQILSYNGHQYKIIGETIDIAVGNSIDRLGRLLGVSNDPCAGANIEKLAKIGRQRWDSSQESQFLHLPYVVKGMDMSFSGVLSYCGELIKHAQFDPSVTSADVESGLVDPTILQQPRPASNAKIAITDRFDIYDICWSVEEHIYAALVEATERALCLSAARHVLIVGGVGCNLRLQEMMRLMIQQRNDSLVDAPKCHTHDMDERYCIDNGCMIAYTGALERMAYLKAGLPEKTDTVASVLENVTVCQRYRTDDVYVSWYDA